MQEVSLRTSLGSALGLAVACLAGSAAPPPEAAEALRDAAVVQSFAWGEIDRNVPPLIGNGDIGGVFDPFGGTHYDELRYGTGARRDVRTLKLTQITMPDYWVLEDQSARYLDPKYFRPKVPRKYLAYGSPFDFLLRPSGDEFPEKILDHKQALALEEAILRTEYRLGGQKVALKTFFYPYESLLVYHLAATTPMEFRVTAISMPGDERKGPASDESAGDIVILKQVSNVYCPAWVAISAPGAERRGDAFHIPSGEHAIFIAFGHQSLRQGEEHTVRTVKEAARRGYSQLEADHIGWWRDFWSRSYVVLPDRRIQQMWYRSIYYLASSLPRRLPSFSPEGGYGVFPAFAGFHPQDSMYHLFAALSSNHPELGRAQAEYILQTLPVAKAAAQNVYYLDGARYPWHSTPGLLPYLPGHLNEGDYLHEHAVNGWIVEFLRRYLAAHGNPPSLVRRYYPVLREIAMFFSSMLTPRGDALEIAYVPSTGQEESGVEVNRKNIFDIVVAAKWSLKVAADAAELLGAGEAERSLWREQNERLSLDYSRRSDGSYGSFEGDTGHGQKAPSQLIGVVMTTLFEGREENFLKTFEHLEKVVKLAACAWSPGYYAIAAARLRKPHDALRSLQASFDFSQPPWTMFIENTFHVPGRMPYYLAGHALYVQGVNEMLLQDWSGEPEPFPAYPFQTGAFKLRASNRVIEARKANGKVEILSDSRADVPLP
ncbi:MAG: hypothetical protein KIT09_07510 [Bryobacteraceae bacterium]|nr:hypothetical protein [Bryobacteraceae bacterium]